jgi:biotin-(acetyl-CoA carboxylase) ligase
MRILSLLTFRGVRDTASTLRGPLGHPVDRNLLAASILNHLEPIFAEFLGSGLAPLVAKINGSWHIAALCGYP